MDEENHPLLVHAGEDELWDAVEEGVPGADRTFTVKRLLEEHPTEVLRTLQKRSVRRVAEFLVEDHLVLGRLGDDSILTMGSDSPTLDNPEEAWLRFLGASASKKKQKKGQHGWSSTIPVLAYSIRVENAAAPDQDGLLQPLLKRWQGAGCGMDVFALPAVQAVIDWKWTSYCHNLLLVELAFFMLWLCSFAVFTVLFQDEDTSLSLRELVQTARGRGTVAADVLALVGMAPFLAIEGATLAHYGPRGWASLWNLLDLTTYGLQAYITFLHLGRVTLKAGWLSVAAALQCILLLFRLQYFSRVFKSTRFSFVDDLKEVMHDVKYYLVFLLLVVAGWGLALHILFREDQEEHKEFSTYPLTLLTMVTWLDGDVELDGLHKSHNPVTASLLGVGFVFVMGVVLMNLLIGILTASLERVTDNEGLRMLLSKAQVIDEIDSTLPRFVENKYPHLYPKYLHVLRVDPGRLDHVEVASVWGKEEENEAGTENMEAGEDGEEGKDKGPQGLEQKVDDLKKEIQELKDLIMSMQHTATA
ncbi:TRP11A [Auxenochlorella protothecoides x Auxenochlorella symbiontica]